MLLYGLCVFFTNKLFKDYQYFKRKEEFLQIQNDFFAKPFASAEELNTPMNVKYRIERDVTIAGCYGKARFCRTKTWDPLFKTRQVKPIFHGIVLTSWTAASRRLCKIQLVHSAYIYISGIGSHIYRSTM